jgi:hypothetical protein
LQIAIVIPKEHTDHRKTKTPACDRSNLFLIAAIWVLIAAIWVLIAAIWVLIAAINS